jgi:UDP-N-acetylglucosamine 2-epimerase (hydrolysing)
MGELENQVFVIGSPDIDIMFSDKLPDLDTVCDYYQIPFRRFSVLMFHPVTTEYAQIGEYAKVLVDALLADDSNYVVIYPNNDMGTSKILDEFKRLSNNNRFKIFPSLRFEYFLTILKKSDFIIGNSSAGIREAPYYGIPSINLGTRQQNRAFGETIIHSDFDPESIQKSIEKAKTMGKSEPVFGFGKGDSFKLFNEILSDPDFWNSSHQKLFNDL